MAPQSMRWSRLTRYLFALNILSLLVFVSVGPWLRARWVERVEASFASNENAKLSTPTNNLHSQEVVDLKPTVLNMSDVAFLLKTGSSTIWRRVPMHLLTTFSGNRIPNYAIYSDAVENLSQGVSSIDAIANVSLSIRKYDPEAYSVYSQQLKELNPSVYNEQAGLPGDNTGPKIIKNGNPEGWYLDRWKFLSMLFHAHITWPSVKWYIYIEDDTYVFSHQLLQWLAHKSHEDAVYYGFYSGTSGAEFAQGGSGVVFPRKLMETLFENGLDPLLEKYGPMTSKTCCGDIALGNIIRDMGFKLNGGLLQDVPLFRPEPPWKVGFYRSTWCSSVATFHHLHQQDMANLAKIEHSVAQKDGAEVLFRDIYMALIFPHLQQHNISAWDNFADEFLIEPEKPLPEVLHDIKVDLTGALSLSDECREVCEKFHSCLSWRFEKGSCALGTTIKLGRATNPQEYADRSVVSGWMLSRFNHTVLSTSC